MYLTKRQKEILDFVREHVGGHVAREGRIGCKRP